ncbi:hypothetical protein B296_00041467, partial [Ensete ventricosum]
GTEIVTTKEKRDITKRRRGAKIEIAKTNTGRAVVGVTLGLFPCRPAFPVTKEERAVWYPKDFSTCILICGSGQLGTRRLVSSKPPPSDAAAVPGGGESSRGTDLLLTKGVRSVPSALESAGNVRIATALESNNSQKLLSRTRHRTTAAPVLLLLAIEASPSRYSSHRRRLTHPGIRASTSEEERGREREVVMAALVCRKLQLAPFKRVGGRTPARDLRYNIRNTTGTTPSMAGAVFLVSHLNQGLFASLFVFIALTWNHSKQMVVQTRLINLVVINQTAGRCTNKVLIIESSSLLPTIINLSLLSLSTRVPIEYLRL